MTILKNRDFFYLQYNKINWANQEKTRINEFINRYLINEIILKQTGDEIAVFDIGFGIGFFIGMLRRALPSKYRNVVIAGCEPSRVNYQHFVQTIQGEPSYVNIKVINDTFENIHVDTTFDFVTAVYVFTHFLAIHLPEVVRKISTMLKERGKFILVVANEAYLKQKLETEKDLCIEKSTIEFNGKQYDEVLHYSDIPEIGKVIDYNREERYYVDLFEANAFVLLEKQDINDNGFLCSVLVFEKR